MVNLNKSLLFRDTLFGTKCGQIAAIVSLYLCCVAERTTILCDPQLTTLVGTRNKDIEFVKVIFMYILKFREI
jgi:hypothetical protein